MRTFFRRTGVFIFNVLMVVAILGAMEYGVRMIQARRMGPKAMQPNSYMDRWTAWRNAPGYERIGVHHNAEGFRHDSDVAVVKPPNTVRIFLTGGSAAYGSDGLFKAQDPDWALLYNRDLIDAYLERRLAKEHPERNWEVVNVATNEFRMHQTLAGFYEKLVRYKPDLMIFFDGHNDISGLINSNTSPYDPYAETPHELEFESMVYPRGLRSWLFINTAWLKNESVLFRTISSRLVLARQSDAFRMSNDAGQPVHSPVMLETLSPELQQRATQNYAKAPYYVQEVDRLHHALEQEGVRSLFVMQPELILSHKPLTPAEKRFVEYMYQLSGPYVVYLYEHLGPEIARQTSEAAMRGGYDFLDTGNVFEGIAEKTFTDYCHLTPRGNELIADRIYEQMKLRLLPALLSQ